METTEFLRIINEGHERTNVEYKCSQEWSGEFRYKIIKTVLAMANLGGGNIVIGFDESKTNANDKFTGVDDNFLSKWDPTKVNRDINNYCEPAIDVDVIQVPDNIRDVTFVLIRIPSHKAKPYICKKEKHDGNNALLLRRGALYYRNKNKECVEISDTTDWDDLVRRCTLIKRDELLRDIGQILKGSELTQKINEVRNIDYLKEMDNFSKISSENEPEDVKELTFYELICFPLNKFGEIDIELVLFQLT